MANSLLMDLLRGVGVTAAVLGAALAPVVLVSACAPGSGATGSAGTQSAGPAQGGAGVGGAGGSGAGNGSSQSGGSGVGGKPIDPDAACGVVEEKANVTPLNLYLMVDRSVSMEGTNWNAARAGLEAFLASPKAAGVRAAIKFFPIVDTTPSCDQNLFKTPTVPFAPLPGNAQPILDAMDAETPAGFGSPIYPALGGAILAGIDVASNNPGETAAVLLVTDGAPEGPGTSCSGVDPEDPAEIAAIAASGYAFAPPVVTFVVGLPGVNQAFANQVAQAGGSDQAILVSNVNVAVEFQKALEKVLGQALPCEFAIPFKVDSGEIQLTQVNVEVTPGGGMPVIVPQNLDCDGPGWKYDQIVDPTKIILCPETCAEVKADYQAAIQILLGCQTIIQ
jgi:hypothetical protein